MRQSPFYASNLVLFRINPFELTELNPKLPITAYNVAEFDAVHGSDVRICRKLL